MRTSTQILTAVATIILVTGAAIAHVPHLSDISPVSFCASAPPRETRYASFTNSAGHVYRLGYDGQGRLLAATNGAGEQVFRNYFDPNGNLTNHVDGAGRSARSQFDALNHCTNTVYADGTVEAFTFDAAGNLLAARNAATTNLFGYDSMNRLIASTARVAGVSLAVAYRRDLGGLATNVVYPGGNTVRYSLDPNGLVTNVTDWVGHTWQITRDAAGRMTGLTYPNGIAGSWGYDACSAVANWGYAGIAGLPGRSITRDAMSLKTREDITSGSMPVPSTNRRAVNTFNEADRLISAQVTVGSGTFTETYLHDPCGALTNIVRSTGTNDGFAYDLAGRMISATTSNLTLSASYDAFGNRVSTTINGTNSLWVIDHSDPLKRPLMETDSNGTPVRYYIWGAGRLLAVIDADSTTRYAHCDDQGSVVALTGTDGTVLYTASYGPYGEPWGTTGTNTTPFGWLGGHGVFHVDGSSLYLTRYRAYDTTLKRFLSSDPLGLGGGGNLYSYALGNPLSYTDPLGLCAELNRPDYSFLPHLDISNASSEPSWEAGGLQSYANTDRIDPIFASGTPNDRALAHADMFIPEGAIGTSIGDQMFSDQAFMMATAPGFEVIAAQIGFAIKGLSAETTVLREGQYINRVWDSRWTPGSSYSGPFGGSYSLNGALPIDTVTAVETRGLNIPGVLNNAERGGIYSVTRDIPATLRTSIGGTEPELVIAPEYRQYLDLLEESISTLPKGR